MTIHAQQAAAEARLIERIREIDPDAIEEDGVDLEHAENPRANVFRALRANWERWPADDSRWEACWELLNPDAPDGGFIAQGQLAAAEAVWLIGCAGPDCVPTPDSLLRLEAAVAKLGAIAAEIRRDVFREDRDESARWGTWEPAHQDIASGTEVER